MLEGSLTCVSGILLLFNVHFHQISYVYILLQVSSVSIKGAGSSVLEGRGGYVPTIPDSPKFTSSDYVPSTSHGYSSKSDQIYADKIPDYPTLDRRQYPERQSTYIGRDIQSEPTGRFTDAVGFSHQHQVIDLLACLSFSSLIYH